jgi:hypothetical protein
MRPDEEVGNVQTVALGGRRQRRRVGAGGRHGAEIDLRRVREFEPANDIDRRVVLLDQGAVAIQTCVYRKPHLS